MYWQLWVVGMIVLAAVLYLGRQTWRAWRGSASGCGGGCAKCPTTEPATTAATQQTVIHIHLEQLTLRRR